MGRIVMMPSCIDMRWISTLPADALDADSNLSGAAPRFSIAR